MSESLPQCSSPRQRNRTLAEAWRLSTLESDPALLSAIAERIETAPPPALSKLPRELREMAATARVTGRAEGGGATILPGKLVLERQPNALRLLTTELAASVLVSGTNGKTTTASMLASILRETGLAVVHNRAGANVPAGIASALLEETGDVGVFEIDEAWLPLVASQLDPAVIVLGNLSRDRLDGYGELEAIASAWKAMASRRDATRLVLNADDPFTATLHDRRREAGRRAATLFGVEDTSAASAEIENAGGASRCRRCEAPLHFEARTLSHLGHYRCSACDERRPTPHIRASTIHLTGMAGSSFAVEGSVQTSVRLDAPGLHNVYNALAAVAAALALEIDPSAIPPALASWTPPFGRSERIRLGATELTVILMKNPAGANALMRMLAAADSEPLSLLLALNDGPADGRDVSWIWDADFEPLAARVRTFACSGRRADELALRLKYAGWPTSAMTVERSIPAALDRALAPAPDRLIVLPTYSALLDLYRELARRGLRRPFWA